MRLVDVDKIDGAFMLAPIAEAPTVEAIPIEFINREISITKHLSGRATYAEVLDLLIRNWRDHNGTDR